MCLLRSLWFHPSSETIQFGWNLNPVQLVILILPMTKKLWTWKQPENEKEREKERKIQRMKEEERERNLTLPKEQEWEKEKEKDWLTMTKDGNEREREREREIEWNVIEVRPIRSRTSCCRRSTRYRLPLIAPTTKTVERSNQEKLIKHFFRHSGNISFKASVRAW